MPITLIASDEKLTHQVDGSTFYYQRLPGDVRAEILGRHTVNGSLDFWRARYDMGRAALTGWDQVLDAGGAPVPYSPEAVRFLPGTILTDIGVKVDELAPTNFFSPSSASSSATSPSAAGTAAPAAAS